MFLGEAVQVSVLPLRVSGARTLENPFIDAYRFETFQMQFVYLFVGNKRRFEETHPDPHRLVGCTVLQNTLKIG